MELQNGDPNQDENKVNQTEADTEIDNPEKL